VSDAPPAAREVFNPFVGLRPYEEHEAYLFFGRDGQSDQLSARLARKRFVAVVGVSGSGKSSLVRAGLFASLHGGFMSSTGSTWRIALLRPGHAPLGSLAAALSGALRDEDSTSRDPLSPDVIEATLRRGSLGLIEAVEQARLGRDENVLVVVDQFEELFRFKRAKSDAASEADAAAFVKLLVEGHQQNRLPIYVMLTMRSDFLGDCAQFRGAGGVDEAGTIPRMNARRRQAIEGRSAWRRTDQSPPAALLDDVGEDPDRLPVLQHALMPMAARGAASADGSPLTSTTKRSARWARCPGTRTGVRRPARRRENRREVFAADRARPRQPRDSPADAVRRALRGGRRPATNARVTSSAAPVLVPDAASAPLRDDTFVDISHEA
jgi:hypothetical protein